jgi:hypothetical protein
MREAQLFNHARLAAANPENVYVADVTAGHDARTDASDRRSPCEKRCTRSAAVSSSGFCVSTGVLVA